MDLSLLTPILIFLTVALGTLSVVLLGEWGRARLQTRRVLRQLDELARAPQGDTGPEALLKQAGATGFLDPMLVRLPSFRDLKAVMEQGDTKWSLQTFLFLSLGLAVASGLAANVVSGSLVVGILGAVAGAVFPYWLIRRRATKRLYRFEEQLPEGIDLITRAIRAGHPLSAGLKMVAEESPEPLAAEFRRVFEQQRFGLPFEESMYGLADRIPMVDTRILVTAILVQREVGGNLAEVLDNLSYIIRERFRIRRQLRVITAQGRMSGYVLAVLPIAVGFAIFLLNRSYIMILFEHPTGRAFLSGAVVLQVLGYLWIRRIVDIEI